MIYYIDNIMRAIMYKSVQSHVVSMYIRRVIELQESISLSCFSYYNHQLRKE